MINELWKITQSLIIFFIIIQAGTIVIDYAQASVKANKAITKHLQQRGLR